MITIIDYGASNLQSVCNALQQLGYEYCIVADPERLSQATKIILPGVGSAGQAMKNLEQRGFIDTIRQLKIPCLGICLGMQLFMNFSEEDKTACLGIIPGLVKRFQTELKVPHMGWNEVNFVKKSQLTENIPNNSRFYFVHSYYVQPESEDAVVAKTLYNSAFCSILEKDNFYAVQFHPEKSGQAGLQILRNFCELC